MATRFSDDFLSNAAGSDFIVRRRPLAVQIFLLFGIAFLAIYFTAILMSDLGSRGLFALTLGITVGALAFFTILFSERARDLVLATEFQNAMLAAAAQLSTRFCFIVKRDGAIVYVDPGFQKVFGHLLPSDMRTIDDLLDKSLISEELKRKVLGILTQNGNDRLLLPFRDAEGQQVPMLVTIDALPRPRGYFLFRGRDYVEKRSDGKGQAGSVNALLLSQSLSHLPYGLLIANRGDNIVYVNHTLESWLGYRPGDMTDMPLAPVIQSLAGKEGGARADFIGPASLKRKNGSTLLVHVQQALLKQEDAVLGLRLIVRPADVDERKQETIPVAGSDTPHLSHFIASSPLAIARLNAQGIVLECNRSLRELAKFKVAEAGWSLLEIVGEENRKDVTALIDKISGGHPPEKKPLEIALNTEAGMTASLYLNHVASNAPEIIAQLIETTEQKNLEQRFAHSQKMQAVGQLAGGVAHDFNNLLTAMIGFCDLLLMRHPAGDQSFADIMQIKQNANRAANLVRQLLAFSRRQTLQPKMLDVTDVLAELSNLVRRLIGENIELKVIHGRDLGMVKVDQGQLEQVFINLAVNARDAMQKGGRLTIRTSHVTIDEVRPIGRDLVPPLEDEAIVNGDYVLVEVIDTGIGIPRELLQKIFEPFFSTKEVGSGTGLGLATVYGIVKQTGGYIYVTSKENDGTTFSLFFRRHEPEAVKAAAELETPERVGSDDLTGKGTVLLVEDETPVRAFAARALRNKGYTVLEADCGEMAIEVMDSQGSEVDVIITDVIMPGINGPAMIEAVAPKFPRVKVVFISGYAEDVFVQSYGSEREFNFLPKPFTLKQLASKVKEVMAK